MTRLRIKNIVEAGIGLGREHARGEHCKRGMCGEGETVMWMETYILEKGLDERTPPGMKEFIGGLIHGWRC